MRDLCLRSGNRMEGLSLRIQEALAAGLAIASTKVGARGWLSVAAQGTGDSRASVYFICSTTPLPSWPRACH
jgi:hypothetical protein